MTTMRMTFPGSMTGRAILLTLVACGMTACSADAPDERAAATAGPAAPKELNDATAKIFENAETHADTPPHGGLVVELGNHTAHAELVLVPDTGELTVHVLDADGQPGKRIAQPTILVDVETSGRALRLELAAAPLDGEKSGDASRFVGKSDELLRAGDAKVVLRWILVDGQVFSDTVVDWSAAAS